MPRTWVLLLLLVAGAVAGLVYQYISTRSVDQYEQNTEAPGLGVVGSADVDTDSFDVMIRYTDKGFEPESVTIKKGERIRFLNDSKESVWPASALHPTHTLYPEKNESDCLGSSFDSCAVLNPGQFFDYTFNYAGEWRYHDHLHGYQTGLIIVQ